MPKLSSFQGDYGHSARVEVAYELWEDKRGIWHATMNLQVSGEDAIDCAGAIANALRVISKEKPGHASKCECSLCSEWKIHNAEERLGP